MNFSPVVDTGMHENEVATDAELVRALLASQFPQWVSLPITRVPSAGTDNAMYRLGDEFAVRLPRIDWAVDHVAKEQRWLPVFAPQLPLAVPRPVAHGEPEPRFPYPWGVVEWLPGEHATYDVLDDPVQAARDLAAFVRALRACDATDGPRHVRGGPLRHVAKSVEEAVAGLRSEVDADALVAAWERALMAPAYAGPPTWFHGDLSSLNLLARDGRLSAVIDWGSCGVGDPAIDCYPAWAVFDGEARAVYRAELGVDDAAWERGKGWVLTGVIGIPYYRDTNPVLVADKLRGINAVLADR